MNTIINSSYTDYFVYNKWDIAGDFVSVEYEIEMNIYNASNTIIVNVTSNSNTFRKDWNLLYLMTYSFIFNHKCWKLQLCGRNMFNYHMEFLINSEPYEKYLENVVDIVTYDDVLQLYVDGKNQELINLFK